MCVEQPKEKLCAIMLVRPGLQFLASELLLSNLNDSHVNSDSDGTFTLETLWHAQPYNTLVHMPCS